MMTGNGLEAEKEKCIFDRSNVELPQEVCEKEELFTELLNMDTWNSVLNEGQRVHLMKFLPKFPENDTVEKEETVRRLFTGENFKFGNPVQVFHQKLKDGLFSPGIVKMTPLIKKAKYRDYRYQQQHYYYKLLQDILISRKKLLEAANRLPPDQSIKMERLQPQPAKSFLEERTKKRYYRELEEVREEVGELDTSSEDENYPEGSPPKMTKKQKKQLFHLESALSPDMTRIMSTLCPKGSTSLENGTACNNIRSVSPLEITDEYYREILLQHKKRRVGKEDHPELDTSNITLQEVVMRTSMTKRTTPRPVLANEFSSKKKVKDKTKLEKKKKKVKPVPSPILTEDQIKVEPEEWPESAEVKEPPSLEIDTYSESDGHQIQPRSSTPTLIQDVFVSFFSLIRDIVCKSPDQRISTQKLEDEVRAWQEGPFGGLNEWYTQQVNWPDQVLSALKFLAGDMPGISSESFVPYVDYKEKIQMWQWIGVGRDSDENMANLCKTWLENKEDIPLIDSSDISAGSPPPPRIHTEWTVRPTTDEERTSYREQERRRYENPHKAYTFRMHDYESVVGPVKGVYGKESAMNKAREHSLLVSDRPSFVTILSLVRDAASRLPNGEGTRADICELLKDSQYLAPATDSQVVIHTVVSGALDRLHYEKDPCVKYDVNRKLWIYLHRNRTEEEFERIHQAHAAAAKAKKAVQKTKVPRTKIKEVSRPPSSQSPGLCENSLTLDVTGTAVSNTASVSPASNVHSPRGGSSPRTQHSSPKTSLSTTKTSRNSQSSSKNMSNVTNAVSAFANTKGNIASSAVPIQRINSVTVSTATQVCSRSPSSDVICNPQSMTPAPFVLPQQHSGSRPSSTGSAQSLPSPKAVIANVNAAQFVSVSQVQIATGSPNSKPVPTSTNTQPKTFSNILNQQQTALQHIVAKQQVSGLSVAQSAVSKPPTIVTTSSLPPTVSAVKLISPAVTQSDVILSKGAGSQILTSPIGQPSLQGLQTIMIKQDSGSQVINPGCGNGGGASKNTLAAGTKPVVARIISTPQVVSVGNLIASTLAASQKQGAALQGCATTIKIQGGNIVRPVGGQANQMNVIQTGPGTASLPRLAVVSQGGTGNLIPVTCATVSTQPKLVAATSGQLNVVTSQLAAQQNSLQAGNKATLLTTPGGVKILSSATPGVSIAQLGGKPGQTMVVTTKSATPTTVAVSMSATTTAQGVILTGTGQSTTPTVVLASQGTLKPAQTVVMAAANTAQTVVMAAQPGMRPIAAVTPVNMKTLQSVKVIPVSQSSTAKGKTQPVFARIITPPAGLTLRPATTLAAQHGISVIQNMSALPPGATTATVRPIPSVSGSSTPTQATIIRLQTSTQADSKEK